MNSFCYRRALGTLFLSALLITLAKAGSVTGRIVDEESGEPVAGAQLRTGEHTVAADAQGNFNLSDLPAGAYKLSISAGEHESLERIVQVGENAVELPPIKMSREVIKMESVRVTASASADAIAFEGKQNSDTLTDVISGKAIESLAAQSASDLLKNSQGVTVTSGADGSSKIAMRGLDSRFVRVTVDGQRQGGSRNALDSLPPEVVQSLEVSRALTPDMDADAIGGTINVTTAANNITKPYAQGRNLITYNALESRPGFRNTLTLGVPFSLASATPNAGLVTTVNYDDQHRNSESVGALREWTPQISPGPAPYTGQSVAVLTQPRIESDKEHRQRAGMLLNADTHWGDTSLFWRSNFNRDQTVRERRIDDTDPAAGTPLILTPDFATFANVPISRRDQEQTMVRQAANFSLGGKTTAGRTDLDFLLGSVFTDEKEPHTKEAVFYSQNLYQVSYDTRPNAWLPSYQYVNPLAPSGSSAPSDPAQYTLNSLAVSRSDQRERELSGRFNLQLRLNDAAQPDSLKFGVKIQQRHRDVEASRENFGPSGQPLTMAGLVGTSSVALHEGGYVFGPIPNATAVADLLFTDPQAFVIDPTETLVNSTTGNYNATETIWAGYGMGRFHFDQLTLLAGSRVEGTHVTTSGSQINFNPDGTLSNITPVHGTSDYIDVLPGVHVRYDPAPGLLVRSSLTRSLARPNYSDLVPRQQINFTDRRSRVGNPDLKPYLATNFDFAVDRYNERYGLFSAAFFYKKIDHFIIDSQYPVTLGELGNFTQFTRANGDSAQIFGLETNWQSPLRDLPSGLGKASITLGCTLMRSQTHVPDRPGETFPLFEQADWQANTTLHWERGRISGDFSLRYRSKALEDFVAPGFDNYRKAYFDAELTTAYKIGRSSKLTFGIGNLLNQPPKNYSGIPSRMNEYQYAGIDYTLGLQWKL